MTFVVVIEHLTGPAEAFGPFAHEEYARAWAKLNVEGKVWRCVPLTAVTDAPQK